MLPGRRGDRRDAEPRQPASGGRPHRPRPDRGQRARRGARREPARGRVRPASSGSTPAPLAPQIAAPGGGAADARSPTPPDLADRASRAVRLLPPMLGGDGRRTYLFLFQNNAEVRATGGIPGAFATMTADDGKLTLGRQDDAQHDRRLPKPPTPLTAQEQALFGPGLGRFPQDVNFTPDFPRSAQLISGMYQRHAPARGRRRRLGGPGRAVLPAGRHRAGPDGRPRDPDADNAVQLLLSQVYADIADPARQNDFFNAAARSVFDAVSSGTGDPRAVLEDLVTSASERRLLVWSAHPTSSGCSTPPRSPGGLGTRLDPKAPQVGVYLNAALPYKLDYYLDYEVAVRSDSCVGGPSAPHRHGDLASTVPRTFRRCPRTSRPAGAAVRRRHHRHHGLLLRARRAGRCAGSPSTDSASRSPAVLRTGGRSSPARSPLEPGQDRSLTVDVLTGRGQTGTTDLRSRPACAAPASARSRRLPAPSAHPSRRFRPGKQSTLCHHSRAARLACASKS